MIAAASATGASRAGPARGRPRMMQRLLRNPGALAGLAVALALVFTGLLAPLLAPFNPTLQELLARNQPPFQSGVFR